MASGGQPLCQLAFQEVVPQASGVALCTVQQVMPFINKFKPMSVDALALISTAALPEELSAGCPHTTVRLPAVYNPTGEAILLTGSLLQLGDKSVQLASADISEVDV